MFKKKGEVPYWLTMLILSLITLTVIIMLISLAKNKTFGILDGVFGA